MNKIEFGDCRKILKTWKDDKVKVQMCVTSPPYYGLRSYLPDTNTEKEFEVGIEQTPGQYIQNLVEVFRCVRDVLSDDGVIWVNIGDSYYNYRPGKGQALVKQSLSSSKQDLPDVCARRANKLDGLKEKDLIGIPWMLAFALRADGWYLRQDIIWSKTTPTPESMKDRCTKSHEYIFLLSKSQNYYFDYESIMEPSLDGGKRRKRSVWEIATDKGGKGHFAQYPMELIEPCILAGSRVGDIVLDPFMGSGTTAQASLLLGRKYLGCELNTEYEEIQKKKIIPGKTTFSDLFV